MEFSSAFESLSTSHCSSSSSKNNIGSYRLHFQLDSCYLCGKSLGIGDDIYMYRGDTPFCSEDCREEQMEIDDAQERIRKKQQQQQRRRRQQQQQQQEIKEESVLIKV